MNDKLSVEAKRQQAREELIQAHVDSGMTREEAEKFVRRSKVLDITDADPQEYRSIFDRDEA
ncbi:hypothetical protein [Cerasicoccus maritimus]|uniref:hypothetical protein n=1 Tax=Cerasicoccus maritimus TaxID=490089 RepID=UPI002852997E|nr:hypothetical protein [Cerasicoccus maritimus]